ncbi:rab-GTPase-TBC domain-containing protein [Fusarium redolens]|uniref:Rab-GTPase-TBC domain-containing protein n=1 Tax=Fusarium redolens TaxID=48865 RepID=A0A9P9KYP9_FUSRE|nr:rab-GTPase-TBC domain-containing protein [Fusarium redolens]KAH7270785.1 rab-GTPase-TBC domain-containing protein [Fusarium redolens]
MATAMEAADNMSSLQRSVSQHSSASYASHASHVSHTSNRSSRSNRSATVRGPRGRKRPSQPVSSASSIAASDKSLTSFPSFSPESPGNDPLSGQDDAPDDTPVPPVAAPDVGRSSIVDLTGSSDVRSALFEEDHPVRKVPGSLHNADDEHLQRLISRHGAIGLIRQISEDLAQRDAQIANMRRRADERERALRKIIRECGLSNLDLETRLRTVEAELRAANKGLRREDTGLSDLMSDAMQDTVVATAYGETVAKGSTIRASSQSFSNPSENGSGKGTLKGWKDYLWGSGTAKRGSRTNSMNGEGVNPATVIRSHSSMDRRPTLQEDLFNPPDTQSTRSPSRASSAQSGAIGERKASSSLASMALRLVAGGAISTREAESRGRATSTTSNKGGSLRAVSTTSSRAGQSRAVSIAGGPKALMAMRRATPGPSAQGSGRSQGQEAWDSMRGSPPDNLSSRQESYGPVEMDAIRSPESQPPTLTHIYNNFPNSEYLTDRFGFIYDQRRKKRQREAAQVARHIRKGSRTEMLANGRGGISPNALEDLPSPKGSVSSEGRPESLNSMEERNAEEGKAKRWTDYLKIATFPTELLSHTPSIAIPSIQVMEGAQTPEPELYPTEPVKPVIVSTDSGLIPSASTTTAVDSETSQPSQSESSIALTKDDTEPVKLLLQQLSDVHDALQREKTVRWNDFLRKVRAERKREGEAAIAAARSAADARYEQPAMILPETRVADGEMIGVSGLGVKGKVGRAKWNEFKTLVLGGIPVTYRAKVWSECSGATALRVPGYYEDLVAQTGEDDDAVVVSQIQMDINRTLTDNIFFRKGPGVKKLNEVLLAYSRRNKDVGYCQGMNLIAANLLLMMPSAEDAFWILTSIIENILPHGYYDHSLMASRADQQVLRQYVSAILPKLSAHLDSLSIELEALTFQWFLSVFTDCLSAEALFRVWDVVLCTNDGSTFLFQVALALLKLNEGNLLQCNTPAGIYTYISHQMTEHAISIDGLLQASEGLRKVIRREDVEQRREKAIQAEKDMLMARDGDSARSKPTAETESESAATQSGEE